jgi:hypothetical protein
MKRTQVIESLDFARAQRAATRAALASPDVYSAAKAATNTLSAMHERWSFVVDAPILELAAGRFEDVSSLSLRDFIKDAEHELARRGPSGVHSDVQEEL